MKTRNSLIIDFSGKAGAGKTFVKNGLLKSLSSGNRCLDLSDCALTAKEHFQFFLAVPGAALVSLAFILSAVPRSYADMCRMMRTWFSIQIRIWKAANTDYDFYFIDEGFFRKLSLMRTHALRKPGFDELPAFVKSNLLYPDLTVLVTADFDLCESRRMARDSGTVKFRPRGPRKSGLAAVSGLEKDILDAEESGFVKVLRYDNNGIFDASLADRVTAFKKKP